MKVVAVVLRYLSCLWSSIILLNSFYLGCTFEGFLSLPIGSLLVNAELFGLSLYGMCIIYFGRDSDDNVDGTSNNS